MNFNVLHRTCKLVVLLCFLHISVTLIFYVRSLDIRFSFVQNQQSHTQSNMVNNFTTKLTPKQGDITTKQHEGNIQNNSGSGVEQVTKKLEKCPETSPLLGKLLMDLNYCLTVHNVPCVGQGN